MALQAETAISREKNKQSTVDTDSEREKEQSESEASETGIVSLPHVTSRTADEVVDD